MNIVEIQPAVLAPSFPVSDTRPSHTSAYLEHTHPAPQYADSRWSSKENRSPSDSDKHGQSPRSVQSQDVHMNGVYVSGQPSPQSTVAGRKRLADGELKERTVALPAASRSTNPGHSRNTSTVSNASNATMVDLSQQLRTRLTYAMIKVQNGWQHRSLEEVESLASASPRSTAFNHYSNNRHLLSPRVAMTAHLNRQRSDSSASDTNASQTRSAPALMSPPPDRKGLAPPANIVSRPSQQRRRPTPNVQVHTGIKPPSPNKPALKQRTPSQNAAMEADAVETLLFMASPYNSGNSGHPASQLSPVASVPSTYRFPSQTSPLRTTFSAPTSPRRVAFAAERAFSSRPGRDKNAIIASMIEKLDEDGNAELDEALKVMDRHHAAKVTT